jgi:hypothetical protein
VFTPETLPMVRLADYLSELASILGQTEHVHFVRLESGSTQVVANVEWEAAPKVRERVRAVKFREPAAPAEAVKAFENIDCSLAQDNAVGVLIEPGGKKVLEFPGRKRYEALVYGPVRQPGTLDGVPIVIGGEKDPVPVHLEDGDRTHNCYARRSVARALAAHLFTTTIRVTGYGTWKRDEHGTWVMERFLIEDFKPLDEAPLSEVVSRLRKIPGDWPQDAFGALDEVRFGGGQG